MTDDGKKTSPPLSPSPQVGKGGSRGEKAVVIAFML
jgi:hypothetical protein